MVLKEHRPNAHQKWRQKNQQSQKIQLLSSIQQTYYKIWRTLVIKGMSNNSKRLVFEEMEMSKHQNNMDRDGVEIKGDLRSVMDGLKVVWPLKRRDSNTVRRCMLKNRCLMRKKFLILNFLRCWALGAQACAFHNTWCHNVVSSPAHWIL